jgi:aspartyl-tRNA(Asn)/glutamyl-tRNA(Gln) amidotransferase subunit B
VAAYEPVIGLEIHAQLLTKSKLFCGCSTEFGREPNSNVCPVCLGLPGALPVINKAAIELAVRAALALGCSINEKSIFARKQYFYPDLPKGYQISQFEEPFSSDGRIDIEVDGQVREIGITRAHLEEDAGKNMHGVGGDSIVDLNRAGTPLVEIVSEPDIRSSAEAAAYMRAVRDILLSVGVNDGNLEEGSLRCDANVSIRPGPDAEFGTRTELKNLNSFRFVQRAIDVEIARQTVILNSGGKIDQETRSYDPNTNKTATLRSKADAHDYRYFPDPDLPPLHIGASMVEAAKAAMGELPADVRKRWTTELGLSEQAAATLSGHPAIVRFFEDTRKLFDQPVKVANWMQTEVMRGVSSHGTDAKFPVTPAQVAELLEIVERGEISSKQAKEVYAAIEGTDASPAAVVKERGLAVVSDEGALRPLCQELIDANPKNVALYRGGKTGLIGFFVGQVMKKTGGSANPKLVNEILKAILDAPE